MYRALFGFLLLLPASALIAQQKIDAGHLYNRIWMTCPMIGTGSGADPKRPMFTPSPAAMRAAALAAKVPGAKRDGILAMQFQVSDDGKTALVEMVSVNANAFTPILSAVLPGYKVFQRGKNTQAEVEAEFKKYKANFKFDQFTARVQ